jgi:hypothetical protein
MDIFLVLSLFALAVGIQYHGRGGSFLSFGNSSDVGLFGIDSNGTPYINFGGTEAARVFWWMIPVTLETYYVLANYTTVLSNVSGGAVALMFLLYAVVLFVDLLILNHGPYQNFGTVASNGETTFLTFWLPQFTMSAPQWQRELIDFAGLTIVGFGRGLIQSVPFLLFLHDTNFLWLAPAGALMGVAYAIGYKLLPNGFGFKWFQSPTDIGEFLTGVFYGLGLAAVLFF